MIISISLSLLLPATLHAAEWQMCPPAFEHYTATIGAVDGVTLSDSNETIAVKVAATENTTLVGTDVLAGFYKDSQLVAWMPVVTGVVITSASESFDVTIPSALPDGDYRMVVYVMPNAEEAKSFLYGDQVGAAALNLTVQYGNTENILESIKASRGVMNENGLDLGESETVDFTVTLNNPYDDKAVRGGLLLYAFAGSAPDLSKVQRMQNFEIKLVPKAQNDYAISLDEFTSGSYVVQAVYLAEDGAQYVASLPVGIEGLPVEPANAKFSSLEVRHEDGQKKIVACIDAFAEVGNAFGAYDKTLEASVKLLNSESGERIANTETSGVFTMNDFSSRALELSLPEVTGAFTLEATLMQEGEIVHTIKTEINCQGTGICATVVDYEDVVPNVNIIKTVIVTVVVATIVLLTGTFVLHRRKPKVTGLPLPDNDSEI